MEISMHLNAQMLIRVYIDILCAWRT